jgi:tetratricopeptide (TPR) repeat protein/SAM-dependent methyltransferase
MKLLEQAIAAHQTGNLAQAESLYRRILAADDRDFDALHMLGVLYAQREQNDEAESKLRAALAIDPRFPPCHHNYGKVIAKRGRYQEAIESFHKALALAPNFTPVYLDLGNAQQELGRLNDALASYDRALKLKPDFADAWAGRGNALCKLKRFEESFAAHNTALKLQPRLPGGYENLSYAYALGGKFDLAVRAAARALDVSETAQAKTLFCQNVKSVRFTADDGQFGNLVLRALAEGWARPRDLAAVSISLIKLNSAVDYCITRVAAAWPAWAPASDLLGVSPAQGLAQHRLLIGLLERAPIIDVELERVLTNVRHIMLTLAGGADQAVSEQHLKFYAAVARQCFINEYVFALPPDEADRAGALQARLAQALRAGEPVPPLWPITVGAYFPLHAVPSAEVLLERSWPPYLDALLVQQIAEPAQERRIAATLPALNAIEGEVSRAVREQYEENPYPRWVVAGPPFTPVILAEHPQDQVRDILVAGCGTGQSTIELARQMPDARILAVDLSLASLSYARRMADTFGLANVEFGQADITASTAIGRAFDYIDVSGVLHHLADPWAGWRTLLSLLRPGGFMQVGLYSELARRNIVAARALIAARGYRPSAEDIRSCRADIIAADDPLLRSVLQWGDFFTISECRDLLFHVQEHRITLPQIKSFLAENGMEFAGFVPEPVIMRQFEARFAERAARFDLDCWHSLETAVPGVFAGMYQFWLRKPAAHSGPAANSG